MGRFSRLFIGLVTLGGFGLAGFLLAPDAAPAKERSFTIHARNYGYAPHVVRVNRGDTVKLKLQSDDVVHGFFLEGHDLDATIVPLSSKIEVRKPSRPGERQSVEEIVFKADHEGKFRYRCSQTCGFLHPFMLGELIVGPNRLLAVSLALMLGIVAAGLLLVVMKEKVGGARA